MRLRGAVGVAILTCACGGSSASAADAGGDHAVEAGPCAPHGSWTLTLSADGATPVVDHVVIDAAAAGGVTVTFLDRAPAVDACSPQDGGSDAGAADHIIAAGVLDATTCELSAAFQQSWCFSGEQQCQDFKLELAFDGDGASGTATDTAGWCMDQHTVTWSVAGTR